MFTSLRYWLGWAGFAFLNYLAIAAEVIYATFVTLSRVLYYAFWLAILAIYYLAIFARGQRPGAWPQLALRDFQSTSSAYWALPRIKRLTWNLVVLNTISVLVCVALAESRVLFAANSPVYVVWFAISLTLIFILPYVGFVLADEKIRKNLHICRT